MRNARALALFAILTLSPSVHAADAECVTAHADAQLLRKKHALTAAGKALRVCAREICPSLVQKDCTRWLAEVDAEQPTVVLVATNETGEEILDVRVLLDGALLVERLDGSPIALDPGEHVLRFERRGKTVEQRVVLHDGEKLRKVTVRLGEPPPPPTTPKSEPARVTIPTTAWILGAVSVASLGSFAYFGLTGRARESDLERECAPRCDSGDVASVRRSYLIADISLGVSVVSLAVAGYLALTSSPREEPKTAMHGVDVRATPGGAFIGFSASF